MGEMYWRSLAVALTITK